jgi:hypothetical protein
MDYETAPRNRHLDTLKKKDMMDATPYTLDSPMAISRVAHKPVLLQANPATLAAYEDVSMRDVPELDNFSDEVLMRIFSHVLFSKDILSLRLVCKRFNFLASDDYLWFMLVKRLVKYQEEERQSGRAKEQEKKEPTQEEEQAKSTQNEPDSPTASQSQKKEATKKKSKRLELINLKPADRDWKWVYFTKYTKLAQPHEDKFSGLGHYTWGGGSFYEGEWKEGKPHGKGIKFWEDNEYYMGDWKEGKMDGIGVYHWPDGAIYNGEWKDGFHEGEGVYVWEDGNQYSGSWKQGERDGYGVRTWIDGDIFKGDWVKGKRTGHGTYLWPNGSKFEGHWRNGSHHGLGTYTWLDGRQYTGEWEESKKHGKGTYDFGDGCAYEGDWRKGHRHGQGVMAWADGTKFIGVFHFDRRDPMKGVVVDRNGTPWQGHTMQHEMKYDNYFVEEEEGWEVKYRADISRRRLEALAHLKALGNGKLPLPIREDKVLDPEG